MLINNIGYCDSEFSGDIASMCGSIESDSALFFMFRQQENNKTLDYNCPFEGVHTFSYSTRHGNAKCSQPPSHIDSCTDKTKMVFKFQACPDVPGSESSGISITIIGIRQEIINVSELITSCFEISKLSSHFMHNQNFEKNLTQALSFN